MRNHASLIAQELSLTSRQVDAVLTLLAEGNTIPFIARYRKEATGELDEVQVRDIRDRGEYLAELDARRAVVIGSIEEQGKLTPELREAIESATTKGELEDLYRPFRPRRRTRASIAVERGLRPLAERLWSGSVTDEELARAATVHVDTDPNLTSIDSVLGGVRDIVAEWIADDAGTREAVRSLTRAKGILEAKAARGKQGEASKFQDYYAFSEPVRTVPGHRVLAIRRGEAEEYLTARIVAPEAEILERLRNRWVIRSRASGQMELVVVDAYRRLIAPSVEVEIRTGMKEAADEEAIRVFGRNLESLLLAPPAGGLRTLGVDPGFRTGCKLAVVGATGAVLDTGLVFLHQDDRARTELRRIVEEHDVELVAVGNGTASRETERLVRDSVREMPSEKRPIVVIVSEAGASVYSASDTAREELPDLDLTYRSAVSIARRVQDPLAELVKIDPRSIGVGQYQHDVPAARLERRLDETVESCVNRIGVEVNTASTALLGYVAGIGPTVARRIVEHRDRKGRFRSRRDLLGIAGLGSKTFQQAAGFLRVHDGNHPLDGSAVHPERYPVVERMADDAGIPVAALVGDEAAIGRIDPTRYVDGEVGLPTIRDILDELRRPGRDPRRSFEAPSFRDDVREIGDLREGMLLRGTVTNVAAFGAFVDIGVHQDGLVHVSRLADRFVKDPNDIVRVGDPVEVRVTGVDVGRRRISLSMKSADLREATPGSGENTRSGA